MTEKQPAKSTKVAEELVEERAEEDRRLERNSARKQTMRRYGRCNRHHSHFVSKVACLLKSSRDSRHTDRDAHRGCKSTVCMTLRKASVAEIENRRGYIRSIAESEIVS